MLLLNGDQVRIREHHLHTIEDLFQSGPAVGKHLIKGNAHLVHDKGIGGDLHSQLVDPGHHLGIHKASVLIEFHGDSPGPFSASAVKGQRNAREGMLQIERTGQQRDCGKGTVFTADHAGAITLLAVSAGGGKVLGPIPDPAVQFQSGVGGRGGIVEGVVQRVELRPGRRSIGPPAAVRGGRGVHIPELDPHMGGVSQGPLHAGLVRFTHRLHACSTSF